jgi:hypothetical protein
MMAMRKVAFGHWLGGARTAFRGSNGATTGAPPSTEKYAKKRRRRTNRVSARRASDRCPVRGVLFDRDADRLIFPASLAS